MKVKKKLVSMALLGMMTVGDATNTFAEDKDIQRVERSSEANIQAVGRIHTPENLDPEEMSNDWINVTLPTTVIFFSDENTNHQTITSPDTYKLTNNSDRSLKVSLKNFTGEDESKAVQTLKLTPKIEGDFEEKTLIQDRKLAVKNESELVKLANKQNILNGDDKKNEVNFKFEGSVANTFKGGDEQVVEYRMILKFKVLEMDGSEDN
ncbi:hypothetical protein OB981_28300 [Bacillus cereus]|nr:hypothetical protein [Bacillus cereus]